MEEDSLFMSPVVLTELYFVLHVLLVGWHLVEQVRPFFSKANVLFYQKGKTYL